MLNLIAIIILLACLVLAFFILIQSPKGGGLSGTFGNMGTQALGVQRSGDVMEKGTWVTVSIIAILCIVAVSFYPKVNTTPIQPQGTQQQQQQSAPATSNTNQAAPSNAPQPVQ